MKKPQAGEYNPYFQKYIDLVPEGDLSELFEKNSTETQEFFSNIPAEKHNYCYAEGKWTPKDVLQHVIDTERVMSYRALVASRGDAETPLPPVNENLYAQNVDTSHRSMEDLVQEFTMVRAAVQKLYENISEAQARFQGNAVAHPITAGALAYIMMGHVKHHIGVVRDRYL